MAAVALSLSTRAHSRARAFGPHCSWFFLLLASLSRRVKLALLFFCCFSLCLVSADSPGALSLLTLPAFCFVSATNLLSSLLPFPFSASVTPLICRVPLLDIRFQLLCCAQGRRVIRAWGLKPPPPNKIEPSPNIMIHSVLYSVQCVLVLVLYMCTRIVY